MEQFITEVGPTSVSEPKETLNVLLDSVLEVRDALQIMNQDDDEIDWIFFGVGGPA